jgi:multidrug efflux pump subunit AcrA (membrane-fusion protein)
MVSILAININNFSIGIFMLRHFIKILSIAGACYCLPVFAETATFVVEELSIGSTITLGGTVVPYKEVTLTAQMPGRVESIAGEEGEHFSKDTVLVKIDDSELLAKRRAAYAEMMNADASLRDAGVQYSRELWSPDASSRASGFGLPNLFDQYFSKPAGDVLGQGDSHMERRAQLHNYGTHIEQARNALMQAQSQIEQIDTKIRDARSKAPFDGVITEKLAEIGDTVQPGKPLVKFADMQYLQVEVDIPARLVTGIKIGDKMPAKLDALDSFVEVRVAQIFPMADPQRHTVKVKCDLPVGTRTGPGQYAQLEIKDRNATTQNLPVIPKSSLVWRGSLPGVYVRKADRRELRLIRLGRDIDNNNVSVLSGLKPGDTIEVDPNPGATSGKLN